MFAKSNGILYVSTKALSWLPQKPKPPDESLAPMTWTQLAAFLLVW